MFSKASENFESIGDVLEKNKGEALSFGVKYLNDAMTGISHDDLILLGAPSGAGKTQLCCNIALSNLENGKQVHFIALEATNMEIELRIMYSHLAQEYFLDPDRPRLDKPMNYKNWYLGQLGDEIIPYQNKIQDFCKSAYTQLFTAYKQEDFNLTSLIEAMFLSAENADLIILDHVHYFDFDDDNENRAMKEIAKTARKMVLEINKPLILVAHLRKKDRNSKELCAGLEEFHGSSDLYKIATKVITMAPGAMLEDKKSFITYFRIPKDRLDGSVTRFMGKTKYNIQKGEYEKEYKLGWANTGEFKDLEEKFIPSWARPFGNMGNPDSVLTRQSERSENGGGIKTYAPSTSWYQRD